ncbi:MAG: hypothetical protein Sw1PiTSA_12100 [Shewanella algae]
MASATAPCLRTQELDGQDISEFHLFNIQRNPLIGYYYSDSYLARLAQRSPLRAKARRVLQSLPANLERPTAEVCELLNQAAATLNNPVLAKKIPATWRGFRLMVKLT